MEEKGYSNVCKRMCFENDKSDCRYLIMLTENEILKYDTKEDQM